MIICPKMKVKFWVALLFFGTYFVTVAPYTEKTTLSPYRSKRNPPEPPPTVIPLHCDRFIMPIAVNNTFFSPLDPTSIKNTYPPNADCVFVLEAPAGFLIKLDFRNKFYIEPSNACDYDYLEIRDGKHGFSKMLGKYCGTDFPPILYSSERYLWLRFHSDENIEYDGFQAVYEYLPRPTTSFSEETSCQFTKNGSEGFINRTDIPESIVETIVLHSLNLDCLWIIEVDPGWNILVTFPTFELDKKNDCESNFIDVFGEITDIPSRLKNFCGVIAEAVVSKTNKLHIRFFAEKHAVKSDFSILYTAYRQKKKGEECQEDEFDCDDDTCIAKDLKCNDNVNCKFQKDEQDCEKEKKGNSDHLVIIIVVFSLILGAMTTAFLVKCIRKLVRDQKIIREHIRQSKESKLDEAGRISLKRSLENINRIAPRKQASQQSQQRSIHILDDESNRYYQDAVPIPVTSGSRADLRSENNYRSQEKFQIKDILDSSLRSEKGSQDAGMCDMACQTRESLFAPVFKNKITQAPNNQPMGTIRFSTFGYDAPPGDKTFHRQSIHNKDKCRMQPNTIEMEDFGHLTDIPPPPPKVCQKHDPKKSIKMEESRIYVDIRNSAPDVIIMTSH